MSDNLTRQQFWTIAGYPADPEPVTMCEEHALKSSNDFLRIIGQPPAKDMAEFAAILQMIRSISGQHEDVLTSSEIGVCEQCAWNAKHSGGDAA